MPNQQLECFVKRTLEGKGDIYAKQMSEDYGARYASMVKKLEIDEKTIASGLYIMAEELFLNREVKYPYVLSLLMFCVELDKHCKTIHIEWYTTDKLIDILVNILSDYNYTPPKYCYNICNIIYFVCFHSVCLVHFGWVGMPGHECAIVSP